MIQVDSVTNALFSLFSSDSVLVSSGFYIQEGEAFNRDGSLTPWVGLYYGDLTIDPHTVGGNQPWQAQAEILVYVQEASHISGQDATHRLARAQSRVLEVVNANKQIGGTVMMLTNMKVSPYHRDLKGDTWLFTNEIVLRTELRG